MLSRQKFYGGHFRFSASDTGILRKGQPRVISCKDLTSGFVTLPPKAQLNKGGPHFLIDNDNASAVNLKDGDSGATLVSMVSGKVYVILLGTTRWWWIARTKGTAKTVGTNGAAVRTVPVGYIPTPSSVTQPTSYDPILCEGGWRRARTCDTGAMANIWMLDTDVEPHMVNGIAVFKFQDFCFYFKESDKLTASHGFTLTDSDVTWYDTCQDCGDDGGDGGNPGGTGPYCNPANPRLPYGLLVRVTGDPSVGLPNANGTWVFTKIPGDTIYQSPEFFALQSSAGCCNYRISVQCAEPPTGWNARVGFSCTACPGGANIYYDDQRNTLVDYVPPLGNYGPPDVVNQGPSGPDLSVIEITVLAYINAPPGP